MSNIAWPTYLTCSCDWQLNPGRYCFVCTTEGQADRLGDLSSWVVNQLGVTMMGLR